MEVNFKFDKWLLSIIDLGISWVRHSVLISDLTTSMKKSYDSLSFHLASNLKRMFFAHFCEYVKKRDTFGRICTFVFFGSNR